MNHFSVSLERLIHSHLSGNPAAYWLVISAVLLLVSVLSYLITRFLAVRFIHTALRKTKNKWDDILIEKKVLAPFAFLAPVIVFNYAGHLYRGSLRFS